MVFHNDVVLFSDKDCAFGNTGNLRIDWPRWYRKAVEKAAGQLWGAERQIRADPANIFLDPTCQIPSPVQLPAQEQMRIHRVVVAHGASERCAEELGGSGSLVIAPDIIGDEHVTGDKPFAIGTISDSKPFVHVLDDTSLLLLMQYLDTVSDFVGYLRKKEALVLSGRLEVAVGEEALLGRYVGDLNAQGEHDFVLPPGSEKIGLREDRRHNFLKSPELRSKLDADRISYMWDCRISRVTNPQRAERNLAGVPQTTDDTTRPNRSTCGREVVEARGCFALHRLVDYGATLRWTAEHQQRRFRLDRNPARISFIAPKNGNHR